MSTAEHGADYTPAASALHTTGNSHMSPSTGFVADTSPVPRWRIDRTIGR